MSEGYNFFFKHLLIDLVLLVQMEQKPICIRPESNLPNSCAPIQNNLMTRAPFKQFKIDSLGFVFLNHLSNNKPKAGGGGPLSIQTRKNCFEKHTPQTQNRNTKNIKGNQMLQQKEKKRRRRKSPLSLSKNLHGISLILDTKYYGLFFFLKKKTTTTT